MARVLARVAAVMFGGLISQNSTMSLSGSGLMIVLGAALMYEDTPSE